MPSREKTKITENEPTTINCVINLLVVLILLVLIVIVVYAISRQ